MMTRSILSLALVAATVTFGQAPPARPQPVVSPEVAADRSVTFRLLAPNATEVRLTGGDIPGNAAPGKAMMKGENGVWEITLGPLGAGAYRYNFNVNGVTVADPRNPVHSESNDNVWSMVVVPGSEFMDTRDVPHGAVATVTYQSKALGRARRMHVYTPPGYELGRARYPVFYLLHGASDSDHGWTSVGRAGFILDNLIAAKKAKPMIVVMPHGHTTRGGFRMPGQEDEFAKDFTGDIMPYVETHYRTLPGRANRAMAGLSMGGMQTLNIAFPHLDKFAYIGVFSSGLIQSFSAPRPAGPPRAHPPDRGAAFETANAAVLGNPALKKGLKLVWFGIGKQDFLLEDSRGTVGLLRKHGFNVVEQETEGGHTWINWRNYLNEFAPKLFQ
jgi:enterochelin esterase-like enzyme